MKEETKLMSYKIPKSLALKMEKFKSKNGINWSAKIRNFIEAELSIQEKETEKGDKVKHNDSVFSSIIPDELLNEIKIGFYEAVKNNEADLIRAMFPVTAKMNTPLGMYLNQEKEIFALLFSTGQIIKQEKFEFYDNNNSDFYNEEDIFDDIEDEEDTEENE
ncbi:hypothetical protein L0Z16_26035 [Burkholderia multivorans]|uniref:hypothetical protein n=1 Tax=Burkholderia multivorans TaxID=87883 RepID=UPI002018B2A3|nr:hypothetical protein [Burkholderia multivorans]MCL4659588.1 hypothetical protein [Burkholderia multivorans]MCO1354084.1 hypothetical protein [Burkholderia multivorans]MCO1412033.1 hypothetical protein [Burkholderia multivorans]MCO1447807.1 hypothetical protein [Burkholderia multivorans]UQP45145.1 hypothetical protein L0Z16_26035 [Burkholderia multivorans]